MSARPNVALARWADQIGANLLTPSSGLRDLGFQASTPAVSGYVNDELHQLYLWAKWLDDGDVTLNTVAARGGANITFTDQVILSGNLEANGGIQMPDNGIFSANGTANWEIGNTTHDSLVSIDGRLTVVGNLRLNGGDVRGTLRANYVQAGTTISGTVNNWNPTELGGDDAVVILEIAGTTSPVVTGLVGGLSGRLVTLSNLGSTSIVFSHDATSTAANRFFWPTLADLTLAQHQTITIWYSTGASRWKLHSKNF